MAEIFNFLALPFSNGIWAANVCSDPDTGWMQAGNSAATVIKDAVLENCEDDQSWDCVKSNTEAIKLAKEICTQCDTDSFKQLCIGIAEEGANRSPTK